MTRQLKRLAVARHANNKLKSWQAMRRYEDACRRYGTPSVLTDGPAIASLGRQLFEVAGREAAQSHALARPRVLYVGTDWEQDRSGLLAGLQVVADVTVLEQAAGVYGQRWPRSPREFDEVRQHNAARLAEAFARMRTDGAVDAVVGQMWGLSIHWRALARVREHGTAVVNISMDDRHAFTGDLLRDQTRGGTLGLAPYLSLACTAAPECTQWYEQEGCPSLFLPEASDGQLFRPAPAPARSDVAFVGANYGIRAQMVQALQRAAVPVETWGSGWPNGRLATDDVPALFAGSRIVLGCGTIGYTSDFFSLKMRDFDGPMSGTCYVTHANPDLEALYDVGRDLVTFRRLDDMVTLVRSLLADDARREAIARAGRMQALEHHQWEARFRSLFARLAATGARKPAGNLDGAEGERGAAFCGQAGARRQ